MGLYPQALYQICSFCGHKQAKLTRQCPKCHRKEHLSIIDPLKQELEAIFSKGIQLG
jgi:predicted ATP-dependent serine protease